MAGRWRDGIQSGLRSAQPAFGDVAIGTLYFVTDEGLLERSTGSAWVEVAINETAHDALDHTGLTGVGGGGGSGAWALLDTQTVTGSDGTITFSAISGSYSDLIIVARVRDDDAVSLSGGGLLLRCGNSTVDTGNNYDWYYFEAREAAADSDAAGASVSSLQVANAIVADANTAGFYSTARVEIMEYASTSVYKQFMADYSTPTGTSGGFRRGKSGGLWKNTASAIDVVTLYGADLGNFKVGSKARLYGRS